VYRRRIAPPPLASSDWMLFAKGPCDARSPNSRDDQEPVESVMKKNTIAGLMLALAAGCAATENAAADNPVVIISTSKGDIKVELFGDQAPITVRNFLGYVDDKFYDDTVFHRVMRDFMIQGGGFEKGMAKVENDGQFKSKEKKTKATIKNESTNGLSNTRGTLAMARTPRPDSATAQFFINVKDNDFLDRAKARDGFGYCVFGKVVDGMDVVDKIREVGTHSINPELANIPDEDVVIKSIRRVEK
jgi:cyclophilin family peptidyl-prolyl cis-trans isomerase